MAPGPPKWLAVARLTDCRQVSEGDGCLQVPGGYHKGVARNIACLPTLSAPTMTIKVPCGTIQESSSRTPGVSMANIDLNAQFDKISNQASAASDKLRSARKSTKGRLETEVASARDRASAAADRLNDQAVDAKDKASSQWQEMHANWQAHVAKVKTNFTDKENRLDADLAVNDADLAENHALAAIDFAQATIDEAESAVYDAMYSRATADTLDSNAR
jgi:hypothetical protein